MEDKIISDRDSLRAFTDMPSDLLVSGETRHSMNERLNRMMEMSKKVTIEASGLAKFSHVVKVAQRRSNAVKWIKNVSK